MKYWKERNKRTGKIEETAITRETMTAALTYIKRGHLPDWNYSTRKVSGEDKICSLPNEFYPLHAAIAVAIKALEKMPDEFFEKLDEKENVSLQK